MALHHLVTFDGGPAAWTELLLLEQIVAARPDFLRVTDHFAGTSAGSFLALWMAARPPAEDPVRWVATFKPILRKIYQAYGAGPVRTLAFLPGLTSLHNNDEVKSLLEDAFHHKAGVRVLGDLPHHVTVCSYRLTGGDKGQGPAIYTNTGLRGSPELGIVDAALRSSAFPTVAPIWKGHVDGAVIANNPALEGVIEAASENTEASGDFAALGPMRVVSLGGSDRRFGDRIVRRLLKRASAPWGWAAWLLFPTAPLLLLELVTVATPAATTRQMERLLGRKRFFRLAPPADEDLAMAFTDVLINKDGVVFREGDAILRRWEENHPSLGGQTRDATLRWIDANWLPPVA